MKSNMECQYEQNIKATVKLTEDQGLFLGLLFPYSWAPKNKKQLATQLRNSFISTTERKNEKREAEWRRKNKVERKRRNGVDKMRKMESGGQCKEGEWEDRKGKCV